MTAPADLSVVEDEAAQARFDDLIAQDSRIEPRDWMPDAYPRRWLGRAGPALALPARPRWST